MSNTEPTIDSDDEQRVDHSIPESDAESGSDRTSSAGDDRDGTDRSPRATGAGSRTEDGIDLQSSPVRRYLAWGALGVCSVLALFALVQFYGSVTDAIDIWIEPRHQPLMRAAFNLVVLLASLVGVSLVVRELS